MGLGTLVTRTGVILNTFFDDIRVILIGDFVGRDATGAPVAGNNLGNALYPWGPVYASSVITPSGSLDPSQLETQPYKIVSGKIRSTSNQPDFIRASGSGANFTILATATPLVLQIAGAAASWTADRTQAGTLAPSTQNTATVSDGSASGQAATRTWGEYGSGSPYYAIGLASVGSNITAKVGSWQAFKVGSEYFLAYVESTSSLSRCFRGFFLDSTGAPVKRATFSNGDTITLMSLGWVFCDSDGLTVDTTYHNPTFAFTAPSGPATGDYWFDQGNQIWKRYNGSSFVLVNRTLVGLVVLDQTNCVASRSFDFYKLTRSDNTVELAWLSNTVVKGHGMFERVNVNGSRVRFDTSRPTWDTAANLAASTERYNSTVQVSTTEYFYVTDQGDVKISDMEPYWRSDLLGYYHPFNPWRAVGYDFTDGSAHFSSGNLYSYKAIVQASITTDLIWPGAITTSLIASNGLGTSAYAANSVTRPKLVAVGQQVSSSCGSFTTSSPSYVDVTNLTVSITTTGRPVIILCISDGSGNLNGFSANHPASAPSSFQIQLLNGATVIFQTLISNNSSNANVSPSSLYHVDVPSAGTQTYKVRMLLFNGTQCAASFMNLIAYEL